MLDNLAKFFQALSDLTTLVSECAELWDEPFLWSDLEIAGQSCLETWW